MNAELIKDAMIIADSIHVHSSFQDWEAAEKDTLEKCADALEAAEKRIAELEAQMPKQGEWIVDKNGYPQIICSICDVHIPMVAGWCMDAHINYCPNCGARMQTVTDCHTLKEGER